MQGNTVYRSREGSIDEFREVNGCICRYFGGERYEPLHPDEIDGALFFRDHPGQARRILILSPAALVVGEEPDHHYDQNDHF